MEESQTLTSLLLNPPITNETRNRCAVVVRRIQQRSRVLAENEYLIREAGNSVHFEEDQKKRMRNKSAFISRHRQRHYAKLLAEHLAQSQFDRDSMMAECIRYYQEIEALQARVRDITTQAAQMAEGTSAMSQLLTSSSIVCSSVPHKATITDPSLQIPSRLFSFNANDSDFP